MVSGIISLGKLIIIRVENTTSKAESVPLILTSFLFKAFSLVPVFSFLAVVGVQTSFTWFKVSWGGKGKRTLFHPSVCVLEKAMATHSSTLAWKTPWTEEPGRLQSMGSLRVGHNLSNFIFTFHFHALEKEMVTHPSILA